MRHGQTITSPPMQQLPLTPVDGLSSYSRKSARVAYTGLWELIITYISFQPHIQWCDFGNLISSRVRIFIIWKLVNTIYWVFFFFEICFIKIPLLLPLLCSHYTISVLHDNGLPSWSSLYYQMQRISISLYQNSSFY